jgi:arginase
MSIIRIIGVPLDLGQNRRGVDMGPSAVRIANLGPRLAALGHQVQNIGNLEIPDRDSIAMSSSAIDFLPAITEVCSRIADHTAAAVREGCLPLVLGGDHALAAGSVAGVATAFAERGERIGLIWLDAHGDMNTPETSPSGNVHGMPVAHLLGHGDPGLAGVAKPGPAVRAENVAIVGARDLDPGERANAKRFGVRVFTMREIDERGLRAVMVDALTIAGDGAAGFHLSTDADWIDPSEAPGVGTPVRGGATFREAHLAMEMIADSRKMVSMDLVEINPVLDDHNHTAELCVHLVTSALGLRIL